MKKNVRVEESLHPFEGVNCRVLYSVELKFSYESNQVILFIFVPLKFAILQIIPVCYVNNHNVQFATILDYNTGACQEYQVCFL